MIRGEISNRPAAICAVEYKILLDEKNPYEWFVTNIPTILYSKRFESIIRKALPFKRGAREWLERNWEKRFAVISIGVPILGRAIDMVVGDYIAETYHFENVEDFRFWVRKNPAIYKVYTSNTVLVDLDIVVKHTGWSEKA